MSISFREFLVFDCIQDTDFDGWLCFLTVSQNVTSKPEFVVGKLLLKFPLKFVDTGDLSWKGVFALFGAVSRKKKLLSVNYKVS